MGKTLQELTIKDNFMFCTVMSDAENCRGFLEMTLQFPIGKISVVEEKTFLYHPEYKSVRLDVYAKDEDNTRYDVEMQIVKREALGKRARYYHSHIDMNLLRRGVKYQDLPNAYVIFVCDFDPFGEGKYCYTFESRCLEDAGLDMQDGSISIFLNTHGKNSEDVSEELVKFLQFVKADLEDSTCDFGDDYVRNLQKAVLSVKQSRDQEERYMLFGELLEEEFDRGKAEGKAESILEILSELGEMSVELKEQILSQNDLRILKEWVKLAAKADSLEQFIREM